MTELSDMVANRIQEIVRDTNQIEEKLETLIKNTDTRNPMGRLYWVGPDEELVKVQRNAQQLYERWYSSARPLVSEYVPERLNQFDELYSETNSWIQLEDRHDHSDKEKMIARGIQPLTTQKSIIQAIPDRVESEQLRALSRFQNELRAMKCNMQERSMKRITYVRRV